MAANKPNGSSEKSSGKPGNGNRGALAPARSRSLAPISSFAPLNRLRGEFDRLFDDFFHGWPAWSGAPEMPGDVEVQERDDAILLRADAPGFEPGDFDVQVRGDNLVLCACESEESKEEDGFRWQKRELYRSVPLPSEVDADKIDAHYRNGVLTIKLPKTEQAKSRKIEIKS
jgi:HSP20 family protein